MNRWVTLKTAVMTHGPSVLVSVVATKGSVPRGTDAWMIVTASGFHGSIGGGTLEWKAMAEAQAMLSKNLRRRVQDYNLGPDLGQCCGGSMQLCFEMFDKADVSNIMQSDDGLVEHRRNIYLFGAGHVGRALVLALAPLPFDVYWVDPRPSAFPTAIPQNVTSVQPHDCVAILGDALADSLTYVMTHSHALDLSIVDAALRNPNIAHVGLIGSATKRARFEKRLREARVLPERIAALICPIGIAGIPSKHPAAIAVAVAAQALQLDAALSSSKESKVRQQNIVQR